MSPVPHVFQFLVVAVAGWINQQPRDVIDSRGLRGGLRRASGDLDDGAMKKILLGAVSVRNSVIQRGTVRDRNQ